MRHALLACHTALLAAALSLCACGNTGAASADMAMVASTCSQDSRGQLYQPGMVQQTTNKLFSVKLVQSVPGPPLKGDNEWFVNVNDAQGAAVSGATIKVTPFMPDHGHGTGIIAAVKQLDAGQYQISPLNLFMAGIWRVTLTITGTSGASSDGGAGTTDQAIFYFCIEG